jgi:aldehyde:ferredoxin oxidoreductase
VRVFGKATDPYVMAVGNDGLPAHDPRWLASLALTYFYDPIPARHTQGSLALPLAGCTVEGVTPHQCTGLARAGLRIAMARFLFNSRAGIVAGKGGFPERALGKPPLTAGETKDVKVDQAAMVREYQELPGVDSKTGLPPTQVLQELGLRLK